MTDAVRVEEMTGATEPAVLDMLTDLTAAEQDHYDHPRETRGEIRRRLRPEPTFAGENRLLVARGEGGEALGLCWVVLFDPGTGLEGELAELYVRPEARGSGIAGMLVAAAVELFRARAVTFACVWTRGDNDAALAAYRSAGFADTQQHVLTWLPL
ncbi:MAG TPA: GNAT family N-acetyltransferase [Candidatus Dormibacteraeota bacterium]|nr:GNAT family N-acetyltransferase [Candidatus Dormibacteraeota bacterium]